MLKHTQGVMHGLMHGVGWRCLARIAIHGGLRALKELGDAFSVWELLGLLRQGVHEARLTLRTQDSIEVGQTRLTTR